MYLEYGHYFNKSIFVYGFDTLLNDSSDYFYLLRDLRNDFNRTLYNSVLVKSVSENFGQFYYHTPSFLASVSISDYNISYIENNLVMYGFPINFDDNAGDGNEVIDPPQVSLYDNCVGYSNLCAHDKYEIINVDVEYNLKLVNTVNLCQNNSYSIIKNYRFKDNDTYTLNIDIRIQYIIGTMRVKVLFVSFDGSYYREAIDTYIIDGTSSINFNIPNDFTENVYFIQVLFYKQFRDGTKCEIQSYLFLSRRLSNKRVTMTSSMNCVENRTNHTLVVSNNAANSCTEYTRMIIRDTDTLSVIDTVTNTNIYNVPDNQALFALGKYTVSVETYISSQIHNPNMYRSVKERIEDNFVLPYVSFNISLINNTYLMIVTHTLLNINSFNYIIERNGQTIYTYGSNLYGNVLNETLNLNTNNNIQEEDTLTTSFTNLDSNCNFTCFYLSSAFMVVFDDEIIYLYP